MYKMSGVYSFHVHVPRNALNILKSLQRCATSEDQRMLTYHIGPKLGSETYWKAICKYVDFAEQLAALSQITATKFRCYWGPTIHIGSSLSLGPSQKKPIWQGLVFGLYVWCSSGLTIFDPAPVPVVCFNFCEAKSRRSDIERSGMITRLSVGKYWNQESNIVRSRLVTKSKFEVFFNTRTFIHQRDKIVRELKVYTQTFQAKIQWSCL